MCLGQPVPRWQLNVVRRGCRHTVVVHTARDARRALPAPAWSAPARPTGNGEQCIWPWSGCDAGAMPEGDVVWWYARRLQAALASTVLTRSDFRVPRFATADLTGRILTRVVPRGKHLIMRVEGGLIVHTHLRMDGSWRIPPAVEQVPANPRVRLPLPHPPSMATRSQ